MLAALQVINVRKEGMFWSLTSCMMITLFLYYHSSGSQGAFMAAVVPGVNIVKVLLIGYGIVKDEATVKSMSRFGDYRFLNYKIYRIL